MTENETLSSAPDLTIADGKQENQAESTEPGQDQDKGSDKIIAGFQTALQKSREREQDAVRKLKEKEEEENRQKLSQMTDLERVVVERDEAIRKANQAAEENAKLKLQSFVGGLIQGKQLPSRIEQILKDTPWVFSEIQNRVGDDTGWDEFIEIVKEELPKIVDGLVVSSGSQPSSEEQSRKIDSERSAGPAITRTRTYTRSEIDRIRQDPKEYEKHRESILKFLKDNGGMIPE